MKKNNQNGFVLLETVIVTVFIISIFTFVYISVVPLIGKYDELDNNYELEKTYKLYHVRDAIYKDENFNNIIKDEYKIISVNEFNDKEYYNNLVNVLFDDDYQIIYIKKIDENIENAINTLNLKKSFIEYIESVKEKEASDNLQNFIFLRDGKKFAYLGIGTNINDLTNYTG